MIHSKTNIFVNLANTHQWVIQRAQQEPELIVSISLAQQLKDKLSNFGLIISRNYSGILEAVGFPVGFMVFLEKNWPMLQPN
jgi:hypothetical protein